MSLLFPLELLSSLASEILAVQCAHPVRVAINGVDASGKTTLADELAVVLHRMTQRQVIRASLDGFHNPRVVRYARGADSPEGFYRDSFDLPAVRRLLLEPLGPGGNRRCRAAAFDVLSDRPVEAPLLEAAPDAILLFDGIFLFCPALLDGWDYKIYIDAPFEVTLRRAEQRDLDLLGGAEAVRRRYLQRYIPGQQLYLDECRPRQQADRVVRVEADGNVQLRRASD